MACNYWLLVMLILVISTPVQGHEACYDDSWTYHSHTYSCLKLFRLPKTWPQARDYCNEIQLGSTYGVVTRLAKVDDLSTDDFIRTDLFPTAGWMAWIGFYYNDVKDAFRWDGYPDEIPKYTATRWDQPTLPYVKTYMDGWRGQDSSQTGHPVCQHTAKTIGPVTCEYQVQSSSLKITCTSQKSPVRAECDETYKYDGDVHFRSWTPVGNRIHDSHTENPGGNLSYTTKCSVTFLSMNLGTFEYQIKMYPDLLGLGLSTKLEAITIGRLFIDIAKPQKPTFSSSPSKIINGPYLLLDQGSDNFVLTCSINTGSPAVYSTTISCETPITDWNIPTTRASQSYSLVVGQARIDVDGKTCSCWGNHVTGDTEISNLTFRVITKPTSMPCQSQLQPTGLHVSCHLDKIYPQALAVWSYRQDNQNHSHPVSTTECSHEPYTDSDGFHYYKSDCSMSLTRDTMTFIPGDLTVQITVNPHVEGIDQDTSSDVFITTQEIVTIDLPEKPLFNIHGQTIPTSSPIHVHAYERIDLRCEVQSGKPPVHSVTLSCDFPFRDSDADNRHTVIGSAYVISEIACPDMNGKHCTCIGNHLTGPIESSPLTFNVTYGQPKGPASSSSLSTGAIVGMNLASIVVGIVLTIACMITFRKLRERNKHKAKQASGSGRVNVGFHKPEEEATDPGYVNVSEHAKLPRKDFRAPSKNVPENDIYEDGYLQSIDTTTYESIKHIERGQDDRAKTEPYEILHADDPNYNNLDREPVRKYATIGDKAPSDVHETPRPAT